MSRTLPIASASSERLYPGVIWNEILPHPSREAPPHGPSSCSGHFRKTLRRTTESLGGQLSIEKAVARELRILPLRGGPGDGGNPDVL